MSYKSIVVANEFIDLANRAGRKDMTHLKIQASVYLAHGLMLSYLDRPLINDPIELWGKGPVMPELYRKLRWHGLGPITGLRHEDYSEWEREKIDPESMGYIKQTFLDYSCSELKDTELYEMNANLSKGAFDSRFGGSCLDNALIKEWFGHAIVEIEASIEARNSKSRG